MDLSGLDPSSGEHVQDPSLLSSKRTKHPLVHGLKKKKSRKLPKKLHLASSTILGTVDEK
jgi:hypothetical protein